MCKTKNAHRLAHIQDQNVPVAANRKRLQHEAHRFAGNHEKSSDFRVSDGQWLVIAELLLQNGNYAAAGTKDVSKTQGDPAPAVARPAEENQFAGPLTGPHNAGGI